MAKTYDTYKDSGIAWIGEIPSEWEMCRLKNAVRCLDYRRQPVDSGNRESGLYPYWGAGSIQDYVNDYIFDEEIVLLGEDGAPFFDSHRPVSFYVNEKVWVNNHIHVLKPNQIVQARYLVYYLNSVEYKQYINGSILNKLTQSNMNEISIVLPSIKDQQSIASFLDTKCGEIDALISLQEEMISELQAYKQSVITEAVTKGLNPHAKMKDSGVEWIGEIPEGWKVLPIKWLLDERKERSETGLEEPLSMSQKYGLIPTNEMDIIPNMASSFIGAKITYIGDLVFNKLKAHLGVFSVSKYFGLVSPDYAVYYPTELSDARYLEYLFKTPIYISEFKKRSSGVGAGLTRLYTSDLFAIPAVCPSIEEQKRISSYIDNKITEINSLIAIKEEKTEELKDYKKSIIYEYVTGKKRV